MSYNHLYRIESGASGYAGDAAKLAGVVGWNTSISGPGRWAFRIFHLFFILVQSSTGHCSQLHELTHSKI